MIASRIIYFHRCIHLLAFINARARVRCTRSNARIRKYLNLIAGHDRYIAAVISVLIIRVHRAVVRLSGVMSVLRVAMKMCKTEIVRRRERFIDPFANKYSIRGAALICTQAWNRYERYLGCVARGEVLINRPTHPDSYMINRSMHEMFTENNSSSLVKKIRRSLERSLL